MKELIEASSFITWLMAAHLCRVILITISLQLLSNQNVLKLCFFTCQTPNSEKKNFNEQINKRHSKYAIKSQYTVTVIGSLISYKQLLDDVQHDIMCYQNSGLSYLLKLKAEVDNMGRRFDNLWYHTKTKLNNCFILHSLNNFQRRHFSKFANVWEHNTDKGLGYYADFECNIIVENISCRWYIIM